MRGCTMDNNINRQALEMQIKLKKIKLHRLIEENKNYDEIYEMSRELDSLINLYMDKQY